MSLTLNLPAANGRLQPYTLSGASAHDDPSVTASLY